jgi:hypothetical protein
MFGWETVIGGFWDGIYILGFAFLGVSFILASEALRRMEKKTRKPTHWRLLWIAAALFLVRPVMDSGLFKMLAPGLGTVFDSVSLLAVFAGSLLAIAPILRFKTFHPREELLSEAVITYAPIGIIAAYYAIQITPKIYAAAALAFFAAACVIGFGLRILSCFAETFELIFSIRKVFLAASFLLPTAYAIRAYALYAVSAYPGDSRLEQVFADLNVIVIFLVFVSGLLSLVGMYTLYKEILQEKPG